jgi:uncharacterized protein (TIGR00251 family)
VSCRLRLRIVPNAKRSEVVGPHGDAIKLKIAAPALEGKANDELVEFLADKLGVARRSITLVSGEKSRDKVVAIEGLEEGAVRGRLAQAIL